MSHERSQVSVQNVTDSDSRGKQSRSPALQLLISVITNMNKSPQEKKGKWFSTETDSRVWTNRWSETNRNQSCCMKCTRLAERLIITHSYLLHTWTSSSSPPGFNCSSLTVTRVRSCDKSVFHDKQQTQKCAWWHLNILPNVCFLLITTFSICIRLERVSLQLICPFMVQSSSWSL